MGLGLATSTASVIIVGSSLMAGIIWWLEIQSEASSQTDIQQNGILALNPILTDAALGLAMFVMALLTFSIRSRLFIF